MTITGDGGSTEQPQLKVLAQYTKDFSFENPNARLSAKQLPSINVQVNVNATPVGESDVEVELTLGGEAKSDGQVIFTFDLVYAGIFRIQNVPQEKLHPFIMIECPRFLFPFAREIIWSTVRSGGFPPLLIAPIDFVALYQQKMGNVQPQEP